MTIKETRSTQLLALLLLAGEVLAVSVTVTSIATAPAVGAPSPPIVAAAASVRLALEDVAMRFEEQTSQLVRLTFGSSGNLARQIRAAAPYELYLAADPRYVEILAKEQLTRNGGKDYLVGRLAIVVPHGSRLTADGTLRDLRAALSDRRLYRFAIANPEHAPYGARARQALRHAGIWEAIQDRLVVGENVGQAAQFALSGNVDGGIIGLALARSSVMAQRNAAAPLPKEWHDPLLHRAVLLPAAGPIAEQFYLYLGSPTARDVFRRHGFSLPATSSR